jgi:hypothetical protein
VLYTRLIRLRSNDAMFDVCCAFAIGALIGRTFASSRARTPYPPRQSRTSRRLRSARLPLPRVQPAATRLPLPDPPDWKGTNGMHTPSSSTGRFGRLLLAVIFSLTGLIGLTRVAHADILIVDRADDASGLACSGGPNDCTLRSAIEIANANGATADQIGFADSYTINLARTLDLSADNTTISGQIDQRVKINGAGVTPGLGIPGNVFRITGSGVKLIRLAIYGAPADWSNIWITGSAQGVTIATNVIGDDDSSPGGCGQSPASYGGIYINSTGAVGAGSARAWIYGNVIECNLGSAGSSSNPGEGISIVSSDRVLIGLNESGARSINERNYIEHNGGNGITIDGSSINNSILNSVIQYNGANGIVLDGVTNTVVGVAANERNIIAGNGLRGIVLQGGAANNNIQGNYIGTDGAGATANPNGVSGSGTALTSGIAIIDSPNNLIGGTTESNRNLISGNRGNGIYITGSAAGGNLIDGNYIGTNLAGTGALGNGASGIEIVNAGANTIGHSDQSNPQLIGGNQFEGIYIANTNGSVINSSTFIGLSGFNGVPGNKREGMLLNNASNTTIAPYSIVGNGRAGIAIIGASANNRIIFTENRGNGGLAIDLGNNGLTPNDPGDADSGPNTLLNYPVITSISGATISGTACAGCWVYLFSASGSVGAPFGGGGLLGGVLANGAGAWSLSAPGYTRLTITAFAVDPSGNTSELTPRPQIYIPLAQK